MAMFYFSCSELSALLGIGITHHIQSLVSSQSLFSCFAPHILNRKKLIYCFILKYNSVNFKQLYGVLSPINPHNSWGIYDISLFNYLLFATIHLQISLCRSLSPTP